MALSYGIHTLELNAEGYVSILRYLKVGSNRAVVRLGMERDPNAQQSQQNSGTGATAQDTSETSNHVISEVSLVTADSSGSTDSGESTATDANSGTTGTTDASGGETAGTGSTANDAGTSTDTAGTGTGQTTGDNTNTGQGDNTGDTQQQNGPQQNNGQQDTGGQQQGQTADTGGQNNGQTAPQIVYKIYVDEPAGALMFLDGNYIGYIPGSFDKVSGIHTVTLQRPGYNTMSYNIELDETPADRTFRFPELEPEDGGEH